MRRKGWLGLRFGTALLVFTFVLVTPGCDDDDGTGPAVDTTPPVIASISPADGATGVTPNATVTITFSEDVEPTSCTATSVRLGNVVGAVAVDGHTVTFTPSDPLQFLTAYDVTVTTSVCDRASNHLTEDFVSSFTTGDGPVAVPGEDQFVNRESTVTLDGSHSTGFGGGNLTYTWSQVAGPTVPALQGPTPVFTAPDDVTTLVFTLVVTEDDISSAPAPVRVMVLEDRAHAFFVHSDGSDAADGSVGTPFATIPRALQAAVTENAGGDVYIAAGDFDGPVDLVTDVSLYGGYDPADWSRDPGTRITRIVGASPVVRGVVAHDLVLDGLTIESLDATEPSASSIALVLEGCHGVDLVRSRVRAGHGMDGLPGEDGVDGRPGGNGGNGSGRAGGAPGSSLVCPGGSGGTGGFDFESGSSGQTGVPVGEGGGAGGHGGGYNGRGGDGGSGASIARAPDGVIGAAFGAWSAGTYQPAHGTDGQTVHGCGGGGGGGGGADGGNNGGGGGGGGGGGEGGQGGTAGGGGGASIAIALHARSQLTIRTCTIAAGDGGRGGGGGLGGLGAPGGNGGSSGTPQSGLILDGEYGGKGGKGGDGADGGNGGGGGGGPVIGILAVQSQCTRTDLVFQLGEPGDGGTRADGLGLDGVAGERAEYKSLQ